MIIFYDYYDYFIMIYYDLILLWYIYIYNIFSSFLLGSLTDKRVESKRQEGIRNYFDNIWFVANVLRLFTDGDHAYLMFMLPNADLFKSK